MSQLSNSGNSGNLEIMAPTSRSWAGMVRVLFQPFDIKKWFILGFTAWLAQLMEGGGSSGSGQVNDNSSRHSGSGGSGNEWEGMTDWVQQNIGMVITVLSIALIVGLAIGLALMWVRSRGKFMFLDNVVHNRALVKHPWAQFKALGNSLFCWNLVFAVIAFFIFIIPAGGAAWYTYIQSQASNWSGPVILGLVGMGLVLFLIMLVFGYIYVLLEDFVVPIMYKHGLKTTEAWKKFLPTHQQNIWRFILYALWRLVLGMGIGIVIVAIGFATCCIGFIPLMIPYLSVVLLLPMYVFFRFLGPEYIRQLGPDYDLWGEVISEP